MTSRTSLKKITDFVTFPIRAITIFNNDKLGLSSLASERFDYAGKEVIGFCLDVGCGRNNRFIKEYLNNQGIGVDIYQYEGLKKENLFETLTTFPFNDFTFNSVTFIASLNHVPKNLRSIELQETFRVLKHGGNIIVTMGNPIAEILVHKLVYFYDKYLGTNLDMDTERGMHHDKEYYLTDRHIIRLLTEAGFSKINKKYFFNSMGS